MAAVYALVTFLRSHVPANQFRNLAVSLAVAVVAAFAGLLLFLQVMGQCVCVFPCFRVFEGLLVLAWCTLWGTLNGSVANSDDDVGGTVVSVARLLPHPPPPPPLLSSRVPPPFPHPSS